MENFTFMKIPDDEISEVPDFNILPPNFFENLLLRDKQQDDNVDIGNNFQQTLQPGTKSKTSTEKRKRSIVVLEDDEIEKSETNQASKNTVKLTDSALRRLSSWYLERYSEEIQLRDPNKDNTGSLLKHFFLEIRDTRKQTFGEEYEPATLTSYRNGLRRYFLYRREGENFDIGADEN